MFAGDFRVLRDYVVKCCNCHLGSYEPISFKGHEHIDQRISFLLFSIKLASLVNEVENEQCVCWLGRRYCFILRVNWDFQVCTNAFVVKWWVWMLIMLQHFIKYVSESEMNCVLWVGGTLFPVNHNHTAQSSASKSSCM